MKITRHADHTVSLRLPRFSAMGRGAGIDDILHALAQTETEFEVYAGKEPQYAPEAIQIAARYRELRQAIEKELWTR